MRSEDQSVIKSNDPVRQVYASLVVNNNVYNGVNEIPNITEENAVWGNREAIRVLATHAEVNAVRAALADGVTDFTESVLFVTLYPCEQCMSMIRALGIREVYFNDDYVPSGSTNHVYTEPVTVSKLPK